jgi:hypothetical protein
LVGGQWRCFIYKNETKETSLPKLSFLDKKSSQLPSTNWNQKDRDDKFPRIGIPPNELEHDDRGQNKGYDMTVGCYKELWALEHNEMKDIDRTYRTKELQREISLNRGESCFFVPYYDGMPMENAEQLFSVKSENRRTNKRIIWAQIASGLAFATSFVSIYLQLSQ